jgi:flagellar hook protein FlgE
MFGSIYVGLSGLSAYSRGLQQISNNVANLNSQGFKGQTTTFRNLVAGRDADRSAPDGGGVSVAASRLDFKAGELRQSDRDLDLAVQGSGFLMIRRGEETAYTRTGSFAIDKQGYVVLSGTEYRLMTLDDTGTPTAVSVDAHRTNSPVATTKVAFSDNLSSSASTHAIGDIAVYDANGGKHVWRAAFAKAADAGAWTLTVTDDAGKTIGTQTLTFANGVVDAASRSLSFTDADTKLAVVFDFGGAVTSFSSGTVSTLRAASVDGRPAGTMTTVTVNADGKLEIGYSNDEKTTLGAVALADFRDPGALEQQVGGIFTDRGAAGRGLYAGGDVRVGKVLARRLEASNVDLTVEFSELILVQRGFQASSQIISVTNDMIQQLFGIRGQG